VLLASNALGIPVLLIVAFLASVFIWPKGITFAESSKTPRSGAVVPL